MQTGEDCEVSLWRGNEGICARQKTGMARWPIQASYKFNSRSSQGFWGGENLFSSLSHLVEQFFGSSVIFQGLTKRQPLFILIILMVHWHRQCFEGPFS